MNTKKILAPTFLVIITSLIFSIPRVIKIRAIECSSQFGPCSSPVSEELSGLKGKTLKEAKKQISNYLATDASIKSFSIRLTLPSTLMVTILEKKPRFALKAANEEIYGSVDEEGEVLNIGQESSLPFVVILERPPNLGEKVTDAALFALKIQERLNWAYQVRSGELVQDFFKATLPEGYAVLFPLEGDIDKLLGALSLIIYELKRPVEGSRIGVERITVIDLRFTNPVLR